MKSGTILLVEDNENDVLLTRYVLEKHRIANPLVVARDGIEALEYLHGSGAHAGRDTADQPLLVLLDLRMPRMDGLETLKHIRADERSRHVVVVVMTSSSRDEDVVASYDLHVNSYVQKPLNAGDFEKLITDLSLYWLVTNVTPR
jgi:two-component system response regulator